VSCVTAKMSRPRCAGRENSLTPIWKFDIIAPSCPWDVPKSFLLVAALLLSADTT